MKAYREKKTVERYKRAVELLGGACVKCEIKNVKFQFDHINSSTKNYTISTHLWDYSWARLLLELKKCQLLCESCHKLKSKKENSVDHGMGLSGKKNCKCDPCKSKKAEYMRNWKRGTQHDMPHI
jgi:hypothetical protein